MGPFLATTSTTRHSREHSATKATDVPSDAAPSCRIVVLASGSGTNLQALLDDQRPDWNVVGVITDRPNVKSLERAQLAGVPAKVVAWPDYPDREAFTDAVSAAAADLEPDFIVLAGFMRILSDSMIERYRNRIINIHPSLLPAFKGGHAVRDAIDYGAKVTGVTVHFVDEELDHGPIITQESVEVLPGDDEATLHARIQKVEHRLLPDAVQLLARGELEVVGRKVEGRLNR